MTAATLTGFLLSLLTILLISRKNVGLGLTSGAIILGLFTLPITTIIDGAIVTISDPSVIYLALAMGVIPIIGSTMTQSGQIDSLVDNIRIKRRYLLALSAAVMGLLPMPGGALLSAPILEKGGQGVDSVVKGAINNWFRHIFILIYPLSSALIVSTSICGLDIYRAIAYLIPGFLFTFVLGYFFMLRRVDGNLSYDSALSKSDLVMPLTVICSAPLVDFVLKKLFSMGNLATLIGVTVGLALSVGFSRKKLDLKRMVVGMKPWNFSFIILGMFMYLHIFQKSEAGNIVALVPLPPLMLAVTAGFALSVVTGRVELPASIIFPVYLATAGSISPLLFALIYISMFFGYIFSPVHPCLLVSCEYFSVPVKSMIRILALPTFIVLGVILSISAYITYR